MILLDEIRDSCEENRSHLQAFEFRSRAQRFMACRTASSKIDDRTSTVTSSRAALEETPERDSEQLHWLVEIILGNAQHVDDCISDAIPLVKSSGYIASERLASWAKQCVVRAALDRACMEIQHIAASHIQQAGARMPSPCNVGVQSALLRCVPIRRICDNPNTLERVALILYLHLGFSVLDCVLLMGCPRSLTEPARASALRRIFEEEGAAAVAQKDVDERGSSEGAE